MLWTNISSCIQNLYLNMRINSKQILLIIIFLIIIFPPANYEGGYNYGSKDQVIRESGFEGFKFIYFILTNNSISGNRYDILVVNYPFLILELIILTSIFLFFYLGKSSSVKKIEDKIKKPNKSKINPLFFISNFFQKIFSYIKEQNRRSLFWSIVAIVTIAIYILEFFTGVLKLFLSLF